MGTFAVIGSVLAIVLMDTFSVGGAAGGGKAMLRYVTVAAYLYCIAVGFSLTLTSINEEREQGTLSLLFLTDLRGGEIVLAKLFTRSLRTLEGLFAAMPLVATCILLGGVTPGEYARVAIGLINALFVSATLGMYISSQRLQRTAAAFLGGALALSVGVLIPFLAQVLSNGFRMPATGQALGVFSPWYPLQFTLFVPGGGNHPFYWIGLVCSFLTGLLFLAMAIRAVRSNWQDRPNEVKKLRRRRDFQNWDFKSASRDPAYRRKLLELNPICWLNSRDRFRAIGYWIYLGVIYFTMTLCWWFLDRRGTPLPYWWLAAMIFDIGIRTKLNQAAGIQLVEERKQGSLEMLLCAPLGLPKILKGFFLALRRQFAPMLFAALGLNLLIMLFTLLRHSQMQRRGLPEAGTIILIVACYIIAAASNYRALAWVGMWNGLKNKPGAALSGFGLIRILTRPILLIILSVLALVFYELAGGQIWRALTQEMFVVYGAVLFLISDQLFVRQARAAIPAAFQFAATGVVDEEPAVDKSNPKPRKKKSNLIAKLWRRRWIRWTTPALIFGLVIIGNRWNLQRDYQNRLDALRANGAPLSIADVNHDILSRQTAQSSSLILEAYRMTPSTLNNAQLSLARKRIERNSNGPLGVATVKALREHIEDSAEMFSVFEEAVEKGQFDLQFTLGARWDYYTAARSAGEIIYFRVLLAIHENRVDDTIAMMQLATRHQELLQETDLFNSNFPLAEHIVRHNKALIRLLSLRDPNREQLLELQRLSERLAKQTPTYIVRQIARLNAIQIEAFDQPAKQLLQAVLPPKPTRPPLGLEFRLQYHEANLFGAVEKARILRLECAQTAMEIARNPNAESIAKATMFGDATRRFIHLPPALFSLERDAIQSARDTLKLRLAITALAIERYRLDHNGSLPRTVDELFPLYVKTVPLNPFTNTPIQISNGKGDYGVSGGGTPNFAYASSNGVGVQNQSLRISRRVFDPENAPK